MTVSPNPQTDIDRCAQMDATVAGIDGWPLQRLLESVCTLAVQATGLDWALSGRVRDGVWSPWGVHDSQSDQAGDQAWPTAENATALERLALEAGVVAGTGPVWVTDARSDDRVHASVRRLLPGSTFAVVAIVVGGEPLGLLHAGRHGPRRVEQADCDLLNDYARSIGRIIDRADARQRLDAQRHLIQAACSDAVAVAASVGQEIDLQRLAGRTAPAVTSPDSFEASARLTANGLLTDREQEVLELVVLGHGNAAIADRLVVARTTVKSHVRNIMRKLRAVNRTELIALHHMHTADAH